MPLASLKEALRLMGADDYRNNIPRTDVPGDLGGDEAAWLEGWDEARRKADEEQRKPGP